MCSSALSMVLMYGISCICTYAFRYYVYWVVAALIGGFFVAFIAMYGWSKLKELWTRFNPDNK